MNHIVLLKDGDFFVDICPTLSVSGYGRTEKESKEGFQENMRLFCEDLMDLPQVCRELEIIKLGLSKVKFKNKNFSKADIDKEGVLQGFEPGTVKTTLLEETY